MNAHAANLTIGYQTGIDPSKVPQADGLYEKTIGQKIDWRRFNSGPEVVTAIASGDVQIGNLGSSPLAPRGSFAQLLVTPSALRAERSTHAERVE